MKRIAILGSTGSIGRSTLSVVESYPDRFQVATLAAGSNVEAALEQALHWKPRVLSLASERDAETARTKLCAAGHEEIEVVHGAAGLNSGLRISRDGKCRTKPPGCGQKRVRSRNRAQHRPGCGKTVPVCGRIGNSDPASACDRAEASRHIRHRNSLFVQNL